MAVLSAGGCWLPRGLTFGPTNGPEDFQELVFTVFSRRLYKDWFLFVDDLSVATGRKKCYPEDQPTGAHDVSCEIRQETEEEKGADGRTSKANSSSSRSPSTHVAASYWPYVPIGPNVLRFFFLISMMFFVKESESSVCESGILESHFRGCWSGAPPIPRRSPCHIKRS